MHLLLGRVAVCYLGLIQDGKWRWYARGVELAGSVLRITRRLADLNQPRHRRIDERVDFARSRASCSFYFEQKSLVRLQLLKRLVCSAGVERHVKAKHEVCSFTRSRGDQNTRQFIGNTFHKAHIALGRVH